MKRCSSLLVIFPCKYTQGHHDHNKPAHLIDSFKSPCWKHSDSVALSGEKKNRALKMMWRTVSSHKRGIINKYCRNVPTTLSQTWMLQAQLIGSPRLSTCYSLAGLHTVNQTHHSKLPSSDDANYSENLEFIYLDFTHLKCFTKF